MCAGTRSIDCSMSIFNHFLLLFFISYALLSNAQSTVPNYKTPEIGKDYPGNDIKIDGQVGVNVASAELCALACDSIGAICQGFVYWNSTFVGNIYGQSGVVVQGGSCFPKTCFPQAVDIPNGKMYTYKSNLRYSSANRLSSFYGVWFKMGLSLIMNSKS